jgi:hypothetical protein
MPSLDDRRRIVVEFDDEADSRAATAASSSASDREERESSSFLAAFKCDLAVIAAHNTKLTRSKSNNHRAFSHVIAPPVEKVVSNVWITCGPHPPSPPHTPSAPPHLIVK